MPIDAMPSCESRWRVPSLTESAGVESPRVNLKFLVFAPGVVLAPSLEDEPDFGPAAFDLAMGGTDSIVQGYQYGYVPEASGSSYTLKVIPDILGTTGTRSFLLDSVMSIRHCIGTNPRDLDALLSEPPRTCVPVGPFPGAPGPVPLPKVILSPKSPSKLTP